MQWSSMVLAVVGTLLPLCDADARFPSDETPGAGQAPQVTPTPTAPTDRSPHTSGFVKAGEVKLHYLDWGGEGATLLFIAGSGDNAHAFDELAPEFTDRFRVLALTRRGYGQSDRPDTGYDVTSVTAVVPSRRPPRSSVRHPRRSDQAGGGPAPAARGCDAGAMRRSAPGDAADAVSCPASGLTAPS